MKSSIIFHNIKGGTGKTTLSLMTAEYFYHMGYKTIVIDLDYQQANACQYFASQESLSNRSVTLLDILEFGYENMEGLLNNDVDSNIQMGRMLNDAIVVKETTDSSIAFGCIASNLELVNIETKLKNNLIKTKYLLKIVKKSLYSMFDIIIIDTPPNFDGLVQSAYFGFDNLLIVTDVGEFSFTGISKSLSNYRMSKIENEQLHLIGIVVNKYTHNNYSEVFFDALKNYYPEEVIPNPLYLYTDYQESMMTRQFVLNKDYKTKNKNSKKVLKTILSDIEERLAKK